MVMSSIVSSSCAVVGTPLGPGGAEHGGQSPTQRGADGLLVIDQIQVGEHGMVQVLARLVECLADLGQREPGAAQQADPVEPPHVAGIVETMTSRAAPRRGEQPDLVVVAHRTDRQPRRTGQLTNLEAVLAVAHNRDART